MTVTPVGRDQYCRSADPSNVDPLLCAVCYYFFRYQRAVTDNELRADGSRLIGAHRSLWSSGERYLFYYYIMFIYILIILS